MQNHLYPGSGHENSGSGLAAMGKLSGLDTPIACNSANRLGESGNALLLMANTHLHIGLAASGKRLTPEELEARWDTETLGQLGGLWRKEWLCEAGADLPKLMKSIFDALVKRFNRHIRPGRKGTMLARSYQVKILDDECLKKFGGNQPLE